jgi:hypothetical protein
VNEEALAHWGLLRQKKKEEERNNENSSAVVSEMLFFKAVSTAISHRIHSC